MSAPLVRAALTEAEARALTDEIKRAAERVWALLLEAHERRAWAALGYSTWEAYVRAEFDMSRAYSYQVLDQGRVIRAIESAAGVSAMADISEREARDLKPHLALVVDRVRNEVAGAPPEQVASIVREVVAEERERIQRRREDREAVQALNREFAPPGFDAEADKARIALTHTFYEAVHALAGLPPVEQVIVGIPDYQHYRLADLPAAVRWLTDFARAWEARR